MRLTKKVRCSTSDFPNILDNYKPEILLTLGAGDVDKLADPIIKYLRSKENV